MDELKRKKRVLSMMLTMHSILRDRYSFLASFIDIILLVSAIILNSFVFVDIKYLEKLLGKELVAFNIIGVLSLIVFCMSIVMLLVNWKEKSTKHAQAISELNLLLGECRNLIDSICIDNELLKKFNNQYYHTMNIIIPIPEKKFNVLKSRHLKKVEVSKLLDNKPSVPIFVLKILLFIKGLKG